MLKVPRKPIKMQNFAICFKNSKISSSEYHKKHNMFHILSHIITDNNPKLFSDVKIVVFGWYVFTRNNFGQLSRKYGKLLHRQTCQNFGDIIDFRFFVTQRHLDQVTKNTTLIISLKLEHVCRCSRFMLRDLLWKTLVAGSVIFLNVSSLKSF